MNIDPLKRQTSESLSSLTSKRGAITTSSDLSAGNADESELDYITQQNLLDKVKDLPEVRSETVTDIGRQWASDPSYPSDAAVEKLATMMSSLEPGWMDSIDSEPDASDGNEVKS